MHDWRQLAGLFTQDSFEIFESVLETLKRYFCLLPPTTHLVTLKKPKCTCLLASVFIFLYPSPSTINEEGSFNFRGRVAWVT